MTYYGLSLSTSSLAGDPYINFALSGAVEVPAYILTHAMVKRSRRLPLSGSMLCSGLALLATTIVPTGNIYPIHTPYIRHIYYFALHCIVLHCIALHYITLRYITLHYITVHYITLHYIAWWLRIYFFLSGISWLTTTLAMLGKFMVTISFCVVYIFTAELHPTCIRSVALSTNSAVARIGGILAPYVSLMVGIGGILPPYVSLMVGIDGILAPYVSLMVEYWPLTSP